MTCYTVFGDDTYASRRNVKRLTVTERVLKGARWLDKNRPSWIDEVDLTILDLGSSCNCVLGQIVGYESAKAEDGLYGDLGDISDIEEIISEGKRSGFDLVCDPSDWVMEGLARIDDLKSICISEQKARERGFHTFSGDQEEWDSLTNEWRALIEARRA